MTPPVWPTIFARSSFHPAWPGWKNLPNGKPTEDLTPRWHRKYTSNILPPLKFKISRRVIFERRYIFFKPSFLVYILNFGGSTSGGKKSGAQCPGLPPQIPTVLRKKRLQHIDGRNPAPVEVGSLLPGKLTCPLKINGWKMYFLLK